MATREEMRRLMNSRAATDVLPMKALFAMAMGQSWLNDKINRSLRKHKDTVRVVCEDWKLGVFQGFKHYIKARCEEKGIRRFCLLMEDDLRGSKEITLF